MWKELSQASLENDDLMIALFFHFGEIVQKVIFASAWQHSKGVSIVKVAGLGFTINLMCKKLSTKPTNDFSSGPYYSPLNGCSIHLRASLLIDKKWKRIFCKVFKEGCETFLTSNRRFLRWSWMCVVAFLPYDTFNQDVMFMDDLHNVQFLNFPCIYVGLSAEHSMDTWNPCY